MADAPGLGPGGEILGGSSPLSGTIKLFVKSFFGVWCTKLHCLGTTAFYTWLEPNLI